MDVITIVTIIIGLITCFFGYKLNKTIIAIFGLIIGYNLGVTLLPNVITDQTTIYIISVIIAIAIGLISYKLYLVGIFLLCALAAYILCDNLQLAQNIKTIVGLITGIIAGILGVKFTRPLVIISTSLAGATTFAENILNLLNYQNNNLTIIISIIVAIIGIIYQFKQKDTN